MNKIIYNKEYGLVRDINYVLYKTKNNYTNEKIIVCFDDYLNKYNNKKYVVISIYYCICLNNHNFVLEKNAYKGHKTEKIKPGVKIKLYKHPKYKSCKEYCFKLVGE